MCVVCLIVFAVAQAVQELAWRSLDKKMKVAHQMHVERTPRYVRQVRSFIRSMNLPMNPRSQGPDTGQNFTSTDVPTGQRFTRGKQLALDTEREGLRYTGYMDAAAQRWVLTADEYLRCPQSFVLVRYEEPTGPQRVCRCPGGAVDKPAEDLAPELLIPMVSDTQIPMPGLLGAV